MSKRPSLADALKKNQGVLKGKAVSLLRQRRPFGIRPSDLVQETAERAVRNFDRFRGTTDPEMAVWLETIQQNIFLARLRAALRKKRGQGLGEEPQDEKHLEKQRASDPSPSQLCSSEQKLRLFHRALSQLPEAQKTAIRRALQGVEVAEIAKEIKRSPAAVSCLLQRGVKALQEKLGDLGPVEDPIPYLLNLRKMIED